MKRYWFFAAAIFVIPSIAMAQTYTDMATILMRSTFKIEGPAKAPVEGPAKAPEKKITGTVFILNSLEKDSNQRIPVIVTAHHVLDSFQGDFATIYLTQKQVDGTFAKIPFTLKIRNKGANLWTKHPEADIATMLFPLPESLRNTIDSLVGTELLARDIDIQSEDIQPGEELSCLGFPFGFESNSAGFPILRSGKIASFPVYPSKIAPKILLDIRIFGGNSGGPVFFDYVNRRRFGSKEQTADLRGIIGVLTEDYSYTEKFEGYFETSTRRDPIGIAVVVPAQFVMETLEIMMQQRK